MFHMKNERSTKLYLWTLSEMVYHFLFLLLLPHSCKGIPQVIGSSEPIVVNVGDDVMLPCLLKPSVDAATQTVEWTRPDLKPRFVHLWRSGVEILDDQNPSYVGRTSLFVSELKKGNFSLKLSRVKLSDKGKYRCFMPNINRDTTVELLFGSVSCPIIHIFETRDGVSLDCKSKGWYPEPEVQWLDGKGKVLSAKPAETLRGPDGLFTFSSKLTVENSHNSSFMCRVHQEKINETRETHIQIPVELLLDQSSSTCIIIVCVAVSIMTIIAVVLVVVKRRTSMRRKKHLRYRKHKLEKALRKIEGGLQHVEEVITTLKKQKTDLKTQRDTLISLQQDDKVEIEKNKRKLECIPITYKIEKMKKREMIKEDLERRQVKHDELLKTTEDPLETTDVMINKMTERKGKLKEDKEQINKLLEETQRQLGLLERQKTKKKPETEQLELDRTYPFSDADD